MKALPFCITLYILLTCAGTSYAQHEFYTTSSFTYQKDNSHGGALVRFDSTGMMASSLHQFDSITGGYAMGSVIQAANGKLYGVTSYGGAYNKGVLFEYDPVIDSLQVKQSLTEPGRYTLMQASNGKIYFITTTSYGNLMEYDIPSNTLQSVHYLAYPSSPKGGLTEANGKLYGIESFGGTIGHVGKLYEYNLATKAFNYVYDFPTSQGSGPPERPVRFPDNGLLYGVTRYTPGSSSIGTGALYSFNPANKVFTHLLNLPDAVGFGQYLTVAPNHKIYGLSVQGGTDASGGHYGAIFEYTPATNTIRHVHSFGNQADGSFTGSGYTIGGMTLASDGKMYGLTASHVFCFDYLTDKVTARVQTSLYQDLGFELNMNGYFAEICRKPSYTYFKSKTVTVCFGDTFDYTVHSDNARSYAWKKNGVALGSQTESTLHFTSLTNDDNGTYSCVMTNPCGTTETIGTIQIVITEKVKAPVIAATGETTVCEGDVVSLTGNTTGTWSTGETSTSLQVNTSGTYYAVTSSFCGKDTSNTIDVTVNQVPSISTQPGGQVVLSGTAATFSITAQSPSVNYQWQVDEGSGFTDLSDEAPYSGVTTQTLQLTNAEAAQDGYAYRCVVMENGCSATSDEAILQVKVPLGVSESEGYNRLTLYPNPANDKVTLELSDHTAIQSLSIRNVLGQVVYTNTAPDHEVNTENFVKGVYIIELVTDHKTFLGRFVKD